MTPIPLHFSPFSKKLSKKYTQKMFSHTPIVVVLLVFFVLLVQPQYFQVTVAAPEQNTQKVQEKYKEMLADSQQENDAWEIQFETLLVGDDGETKITYTVSPWDTLSKIAKLFGTTVDAIKRANNIDDDTLRVWKKLTIAYDKSIIYDIPEDISVKEFTKKYNLNMDDILTLNYLDSPDKILEKWQQVFVPLNKIEAEERGLIEKKRFVMLDIPEKKEEDNWKKEDVSYLAKWKNGTQKYQQKIVSAEETAKYLQQLEQAKKESQEAEKKARELERQAEEARKEAEKQAKLKQKAEKQKAEKIAAEKAKQAAKARAEAKRKKKILQKAEQDQKARKKQEKKSLTDIASQCSSSQCYHQGKCRTKPSQAVCAPNDPDNAWVCKKWFIDTWRSCITPQEQKKKIAKATAPKKSGKVLKQWYFNPYKKWYSNGRWWWHCTHYAGYYRSRKLWKETNWRGNAKYRYSNAKAAGRRVGQTPVVKSIIVMKYGSQWWWSGYW